MERTPIKAGDWLAAIDNRNGFARAVSGEFLTVNNFLRVIVIGSDTGAVTIVNPDDYDVFEAPADLAALLATRVDIEAALSAAYCPPDLDPGSIALSLTPAKLKVVLAALRLAHMTGPFARSGGSPVYAELEVELKELAAGRER